MSLAFEIYLFNTTDHEYRIFCCILTENGVLVNVTPLLDDVDLLWKQRRRFCAAQRLVEDPYEWGTDDAARLQRFQAHSLRPVSMKVSSRC